MKRDFVKIVSVRARFYLKSLNEFVLLPVCWKVVSPTRKETSYSDQTLTFASHSKTIQKFVRPTRSPRQQCTPRRTKSGDLSIVFFSQVGLRSYQHSCTLHIYVPYLAKIYKDDVHEIPLSICQFSEKRCGVRHVKVEFCLHCLHVSASLIKIR